MSTQNKSPDNTNPEVEYRGLRGHYSPKERNTDVRSLKDDHRRPQDNASYSAPPAAQKPPERKNTQAHLLQGAYGHPPNLPPPDARRTHTDEYTTPPHKQRSSPDKRQPSPHRHHNHPDRRVTSSDRRKPSSQRRMHTTPTTRKQHDMTLIAAIVCASLCFFTVIFFAFTMGVRFAGGNKQSM